ncbi:hypothetical protein D2T29_12930 [Sinirhodobacter populi]|uniref:Transglycosylase SLT domain-containing protein n=1 Tax=Paenirhodobacter populi TaxID=2306993 RepID=A0A443KCK6_9RHOB|nr:hypothetical protein [Sinirhodobacter populi]RWR30569.1 hypothetical protein D2T29_12930 [Sinirhodobacter populi]
MRKYYILVTLLAGSTAHADPTAHSLIASQNYAASLYLWNGPESTSSSTLMRMIDPADAIVERGDPANVEDLFVMLDYKEPPLQDYDTTADNGKPIDLSNLPTTFPEGSPEDMLFRLIKRVEAGPKGYDAVWTGSRHPLPSLPSKMTVCEVWDWQVAAARVQRSTAIGLYQVVGATFRSAALALDLSCNDKFDAKTQDRIGLALLYRRGWAQFKEGAARDREMNVEDFAYELAGEWAAFPAPYGENKGKSRYWRDGVNRHLIELPDYIRFLQNLRNRIYDDARQDNQITASADSNEAGAYGTLPEWAQARVGFTPLP